MAIGNHEFDFGPDVLADFIDLLANPGDLLLPGDEPNSFAPTPGMTAAPHRRLRAADHDPLEGRFSF